MTSGVFAARLKAYRDAFAGRLTGRIEAPGVDELARLRDLLKLPEEPKHASGRHLVGDSVSPTHTQVNERLAAMNLGKAPPPLDLGGGGSGFEEPLRGRTDRQRHYRKVSQPEIVARTILESVAFWAMHRHFDPSPRTVSEADAEAALQELVTHGLLQVRP